jgi:hypothetical protein
MEQLIREHPRYASPIVGSLQRLLETAALRAEFSSVRVLVANWWRQERKHGR